ncbi:MAG: selenocysteine-specific translation elongation factor, partial [Chloroflexi bacterium]|nr:selenocysteine-specific translation elongation factor [Chloroflexota bacterium]
HVDHGKSSLVLALTGIDPDRLPEEKAREMTIDLGFAWLTLPSGESVGIVDVPGHIDFIKNMLAGVGSIDAALFVVAADEGVMPQTREHLAILDLMQVPAGVVALTKIDLIREPEWLELVTEEVSDLLASTPLAGAPMVPVSARTGEGLPQLLQALEGVLQDAPPRRDLGRPRLPIDRVFTVAGFGTVVTGTLSDGSLEIGQEVEIVPGGLRARIRGLQTHKHKIERAVPGSRVAINLSGVRTEQLQRGQVVTLPGLLRTTQLVDLRLRVLADASGPLKHNQEVDFFSGAAEVVARTRLLDAEVIPPGGEGWVQLRLRQPAAVAAGDRFILRQPSPSRTLGGGQVVNPHPGRRHRRFRSETIAGLETLARGQPPDILLQRLQEREPAGAREVVSASGLEEDIALGALEELLATGQASFLGLGEAAVPAAQAVAGNRYLVSAAGWRQLTEQLQAVLADYHRQYPLRLGMPREELKSRLQPRRPWPGRLFNELVGRATAEGVVAEVEGAVRTADHVVRFTPQQQKQVDAVLGRFRAQPYTPPSVAEATASVGPDVLQALIEANTLTRISEDVLFLTETYEQIVARIMTHLRAEGSITVAQVRDLFGTSRKYALPLMEHLDERRLTRRVGDARVLR